MEISVKINVRPFELFDSHEDFSVDQMVLLVKELKESYTTIEIQDFERFVMPATDRRLTVILLSGCFSSSAVSVHINKASGGVCKAITEERYNEIYEEVKDDNGYMTSPYEF